MSSNPLHFLPEPVLEKALSYLPLPSILSTSSTCKFLNSLVSSIEFIHLYSLTPTNRSPWFFLFGINHLIPSKNQSFAFDPISFSWIRIPFVTPPRHNHSSLGSSNGMLFALAGANQDRLCFAPMPLKQDWKVIESPMEVSRKEPIVGIITDAANEGTLVVVGGGEEVGEETKVEFYDEIGKRWRRGSEAMPIRGASSLSSLVYRGRMYVADRYSGKICRMDGAGGLWTLAEAERPTGAKWWNLVAIDGNGGGSSGLAAVVVCAKVGVKIVSLDEDTMRVKQELGTMPLELFQMLNSPNGGDEAEVSVGKEEEEDVDPTEKHLTLGCTGGAGRIIYLYSTSKFALECPMVVVCKIEASSSGACSCSWLIPPLLPPIVHRFDHVFCLSSHVPLASCLTS